MNHNEKSNSKEMDQVLNNRKKGKRVAALAVVLCLVVAVCMIAWQWKDSNGNEKEMNEKEEKTKDVKIEDISVEGDQMTLKIDRKFEVYDKDPTETYVDEPQAKALGEIKVVIDGTADFSTEKFDGKMDVDGYELDGDVVGYCANKLDFGNDKEYKWSYSLDAINASDDENAKLRTLQYSVMISEDLREIIIYVYPVDNHEDIAIIYSKI